ncbi:conserved domain protein [Bacteroides fluxus YIT 12057]|uniref:Conserved domain protein n=1 Tax=Bacteroides fluxus YIT 12057 TaxID=763034 RepID=F3PWC4_9BACE|nr:conserved domain protein [Bacteroides fluxus YIT 12057]
MAAALGQQVFFILLDESGGEGVEGKFVILGETDKTVDGAGVNAGGTVASGLFGLCYQRICVSIYSLHNLIFNELVLHNKPAGEMFSPE